MNGQEIMELVNVISPGENSMLTCKLSVFDCSPLTLHSCASFTSFPDLYQLMLISSVQGISREHLQLSVRLQGDLRSFAMHPSGIDRNLSDLLIRVENLPESALKCASQMQSRIADCLFEMSRLKGVGDFRTSLSLPLEFLKLLQKVMDLYDESVRFLLGHFRRCGVTTRCGPGCAYCCCHMPAGVSTVELLYVYHGMHQVGNSDIFFRRCLEVQEMWTEIMLQHEGNSSLAPAEDVSRDVLLTRYQSLGQPCPFLQQDHCQIYPYRPFACRMHFSVSPPHWCQPAHFQFSHAVRFNLQPSECVFEGLDKLDESLQISLSEVLAPGLLELMVNIIRFEQIRWTP